MSQGIIWLIAIVVFLVLEAVTYQLVSIWFAIGAVGGLIAYVCGAGFYLQFGIFVILSVVLLAALRPVSLRLVKNRKIKTNADSLEGKTVLITSEVDNLKGTGQGKIDGMVWTVRSAKPGEVISEGATARVVKIEGVKIIAEKID